jgi:MFS family permease
VAPNLAVLTATQTIARPLALSLDMVIAVVATEEMPKGARAYALSLLSLSAGLGAGLCVMALPIADHGIGGWRLVYILPLVFLIPTRALRSRLPESRRFVAPHAHHATMRGHWQRFALLAGAGLFINLLVAPASGLQNAYLKDVRGYSATAIAFFTVCTQTPAGIGVVLGGELADRYGRRIVGSIALIIGAVASALTFYVTGWPLWAWSMVGSVIGGAAVPALGVYQTELFPTAIRARAKAGIVVVTLVGLTVGLVVAGIARSRGVSFFNIMGLLMAGPLAVSLIIWFLYPETAHLELETLNPEDRSPP